MTHVPFLDVAGTARWIRRDGAEAIIAALTDAVESDFRRWPRFDKTPRVASHSRDGVIELMPTSDGEAYGFKYVNGHPSNPARGLQTVTAFGVLARVDSGYPTFVAEMTLLTALRTAATSAMAARHLARPDASVMAMIGTGSQSEFQALGFRAALGIRSLRIWDVDEAAMAKFVRNVEPLGFTVHVASSAADAVRGADVITTCTADKQRAVVLTDDMVAPGVHINAIGGDCPGKTELDPAILHRADVFVEYEPQTRIEGEIQAVAPDSPVTELWRVVGGEAPGRRDASSVTVFDSVGFAVEDFAALTFAHRAVAGTDLVSWLDLIADPADPKDLFALVAEAGVALSPAS
ncbi:ornithine cyclodeaminase [Aeromicrobium duanguangcaii]|uniref:Ornithine cyclodeaminase n=1 Tax=Aeromicrobium duanguangcaii TaxID=2968086 RepID=A0ABY5KBC3_9ACTN|nr:ornithine cyclodeaminase [Aeromicrobium duanguangcaii]MCD9154851.1 ornithine cyclodeaminase [Aeromicrobium duanguangcaii]UUI67737.1 ornithine cyclodeaminase [Aeromicrobium duanguangcaii]